MEVEKAVSERGRLSVIRLSPGDMVQLRNGATWGQVVTVEADEEESLCGDRFRAGNDTWSERLFWRDEGKTWRRYDPSLEGQS